jgi:hypothetical protein
MKKLTAAFGAILIVNCLFAQSSFSKLITRPFNNLFVSRSMNDCIKTLNGGYAITQFYSTYAYVAVMDSNFNILWARAINVAQNFKTAGFTIAQSTVDGSFCIGGITSDPARPEYDICIISISKHGKVRSINSYVFNNTNGGDIKVLSLPDGGFLMAAEGGSQVGLIKLNTKCEITKVKALSYADGALFFNDMIATNDSSYLLIGNVFYGGGVSLPRDIYCTKIDSSLKLKWTRLYSNGKLSEIEGAVASNDGGYFLCGAQTELVNTADSYTRLLKVDSLGHMQWHVLGRFQDNGSPNFAVQTEDSGFVMAGTSDIFKVDSIGNFKWVSDRQTVLSYGLIETADKGFVTFRDYFNPYFNIIKVDSLGRSCSPDFTTPYNKLDDSLSEKTVKFWLSQSTINHIATGNVFFNTDTTSTPLCGIVLATKFFSFVIEHSENGNKLSWKINSNFNAVSFIVERSSDGKHFTSISSVNASGKTNYSFIDNNLLPSINYYRIKAISADGGFAYSDIKTISGANNKIMLYPNPVQKTVNISFENSMAGKVSIELINMQGKIISVTAYNALAGVNIKSLGVCNLPKGIYFLKITMPAGKTSTVSFIKE